MANSKGLEPRLLRGRRARQNVEFHNDLLQSALPLFMFGDFFLSVGDPRFVIPIRFSDLEDLLPNLFNA